MAVGASVGQLYSCSLALRWAHLRRQFGKPGKDQPEYPLINYQLHQYRLIPKFARGFVLKFGVDELMALYVSLKPQIIDPNTNLEFLHAIATFTKSYASTAAQRTYEEVRQSLGGFGYSYYSELHSMLNDNDVNMTWEGDNKVLLQQTARFILKNCNRIQNGKQAVSEHVSYLKEYHDSPQKFMERIAKLDFDSESLTLDCMTQVYMALASLSAFKAMKYFQSALEQGKDMFDAYLESVPFELNPMALAFGEVFYLQAYQRRLGHYKCEETKAIFTKLGLLYAIWNILERLGDFRQIVSSEQVSQLKDRSLKLCSDIRNEVIPLTKTLGIHWYNIFAHPDFYERFLSVMAQTKGAFERVSNWEDCLGIPPGVDAVNNKKKQA